jgi:hypothetical protein
MKLNIFTAPVTFKPTIVFAEATAEEMEKLQETVNDVNYGSHMASIRFFNTTENAVREMSKEDGKFDMTTFI